MSTRTHIFQARLAAALAAALGVGVAGLALPTPAYAQVITGSLAGRVAASSPVHIEVFSPQTGYSKMLQPQGATYSLSGLRPGTYIVTFKVNQATVAQRTVTVRANMTTTVPAVAVAAQAATPADAQQLGAVQVSAANIAMDTDINPIDVSTSQLQTHISMRLVNKLPVDRSVYAVAGLMSNVHSTTGVGAFLQSGGNLLIGGATVGGNRYYTNGFDTTNDFQGIGDHAVPAEAVTATAMVANGANASFTNAPGGVLTQTIKQGTNKYQFGYDVYITPPTSRLLEPRGHNVVNPDGNYYSFVSSNRHGFATTQNVWASGPIIKDKLFAYALFNDSLPSRSRGVGRNTVSYGASRDRQTLLNLTWDITDNQSLNLFGDREVSNSTSRTYQLEKLYDIGSVGAFTNAGEQDTDQKFLIGNYHFNITPDLEFVAMGGYFDGQGASPLVGDPYSNEPYVVSVDPNTQVATVISRNRVNAEPSLTRFNKRGFTTALNWQLGDNDLSFGAQYYKYEEIQFHGTASAGSYTYLDRPGALLGNGYTVPGNGKYVEQDFFQIGGKTPTKNYGVYLQDNYHVTQDVVLYGGLRQDYVKHMNTAGEAFITFHNLSPRIGASWDVRGDGTFKIGATFGKYYQLLPSRTIFGLAAIASSYSKYFTYTGMGPTTKAPTGLDQIGPTNVTSSFGQAKVSDEIAVRNLKPIAELQGGIYAQMRFNDAWSGLVKFSGSKLLRGMNQTCDGAAIDDYAHAHGYPSYDADGEFLHSCILANPGYSLVIERDFAGNGGKQILAIPADAYGLRKSTRHFYSLTFRLTHNRTQAQPYYLNLGYTWTHEYGNNSGIIDESSQGARIYVGQNPQFRYPILQTGDTGDLDQDIPSAFTASGVYYFNNGFTVSGFLNAHTGQPLSCFGTYVLAPNSYAANNAGASSFVCDGKVVPLGSAGRLPFFWSLNLGAGYHFRIGQHNFVQLDFKVMNVTNRNGVIARNETFDQGFIPADGSLPPKNINYGLPGYQAPRSVVLDFRYSWR